MKRVALKNTDIKFNKKDTLNKVYLETYGVDIYVDIVDKLRSEHDEMFTTIRYLSVNVKESQALLGQQQQEVLERLEEKYEIEIPEMSWIA